MSSFVAAASLKAEAESGGGSLKNESGQTRATLTLDWLSN